MTCFRPMGWDCKNGTNCFNTKKRLKFGAFYDHLPDSNSFTDVDGACNINEHFMFVEAKGHTSVLDDAQRLFYARLVGKWREEESGRRINIRAMSLQCNAETMACAGYREITPEMINRRVPGLHIPASLQDVQALIREWGGDAKPRTQKIWEQLHPPMGA